MYWASKTSGKVSYVSKSGGGATVTLASGQDTPRGLIIDDTYVYFANYSNVGSVQRVPKSGGAAPTVVAANQYYPYRMAVNGTTLFFTNDSTGGNVSSVAKGGGPVTVVAASQSSPRGIAVDATNVYWSTYQQVESMLTGGGGLVKVSMAEEFPFALTSDAANLYWYDEYMDAVRSAPKTGGSVSTLTTMPTSHDHGGRAIAVDASFVYFNDRVGNTVQKVSKNGGVPVVVATANGPTGIALDQSYVYFTNQGDGTIRRAPK